MYLVAKYMQKTAFLIPIFAFIPAIRQHEMAKQVSETYYNGLRIQLCGKQVRDNRIRWTKHIVDILYHIRTAYAVHCFEFGHSYLMNAMWTGAMVIHLNYCPHKKMIG